MFDLVPFPGRGLSRRAVLRRRQDPPAPAGDPAAPPPTPAPAPAPTPPAPAPAPAPTPPAPAPAPQPQPVAYDADYAHRLREEARVNRERYEAAERERDQAKQATAERDQRIAALEAAEADRQHAAVLTTIGAKPEVSANVALLSDSSAWQRASKDLDWSKPEAVEAKLTEFLTANPAYKVAPSGPGSSGPARPGGASNLPPVGQGSSLRAALQAAVAGGA